MRLSALGDKRQGAIAPLAAVLAVFLIGMVAFAVDIGWIVLSKTNLQNTADSAALAGADPLMNG
jgi:Flp pilus assembly protein TadG